MAPAEKTKKSVKKASKMKNPIEQLGCLVPHRYTTDSELITFETCWATHLDEPTFEWVFTLFKENMQEMYRLSQWGYDPESKRNELQATTARYIIAKNKDDEKVGYAHYRFDVDHDCAVLYCYEIQVCDKYQKKGVGSMLMATLEALAERTGMEKIMATVLAFNAKSLGFFHKLGYTSDFTCPDENQGLDYLILSKSAN